MTDILTRQEVPDDFNPIREINNLAFNQKQDGELIENLRKNPSFVTTLSLVAIHNHKFIGLGFGGGMINYPEEYYAAE